MVVGHPLDIVFQGVDTGRGDDAGLAHGAAELVLEAPRPMDEIGATSQNRADWASQAFR